MTTTRASWLMLPLGIMWIARGVLTIMIPEVPDAALPHQLVAAAIRSALWIVTGMLAIVLTAMHLPHAIPALIVMPAAMAASYLIDAFASLTPPNPPGAISAWPQLAYWASVTWLLWIMSGWRITHIADGSTGDATHVAGDTH